MKTSQQEEETYPQFEILKELIASQQYEKAKNEYLNSDEALAKINDASAHETRLNLLINYCYLLTETGHALFEEKKMFGIFDVCFNRQNRREAIKAFEISVKSLPTASPYCNLTILQTIVRRSSRLPRMHRIL